MGLAQRVLDGAPVSAVLDAGKDAAYRTVLVGDAAALRYALGGGECGREQADTNAARNCMLRGGFCEDR
jgi:hypothetical protein